MVEIHRTQLSNTLSCRFDFRSCNFEALPTKSDSKRDVSHHRKGGVCRMWESAKGDPMGNRAKLHGAPRARIRCLRQRELGSQVIQEPTHLSGASEPRFLFPGPCCCLLFLSLGVDAMHASTLELANAYNFHDRRKLQAGTARSPNPMKQRYRAQKSIRIPPLRMAMRWNDECFATARI